MNSENIRQIENPPLFIRRKSLPIWLCGIAVMILIVIMYGDFYKMEDQEQAIRFLSANAGLLVTILAVTMSFTLLGIRFFADSYSPRALMGYLKDKVVYGFPIVYLALISLNLISSAVPSFLSPVEFLQYSVIGTIFSLLYLVAFVYYTISKIQPGSVLKELSRNIHQDVWKRIVENRAVFDIDDKKLKPFVILEQMMAKSVSNNDIFSFVEGLNLLFGILNHCLNKIEDEYKFDNNFQKRQQNSNYVYRFFFLILSPLVSDSFRNGRENFILQYQGHLFNQFRMVYLNRNYNGVEDFWKQLDFIGNKIFNIEMLSVEDSYLRQLRSFIVFELNIIKRFKLVLPKDPMGIRQHSINDTIDDALVHDFQSSRIKSITQFGVIAANKRMENSVGTIFSILNTAIIAVLKMNDRIIRGYTLHTIIESIKVIHERATENNLYHTTETTARLGDYIKAIDRRYLNELEGPIASLCKLSIYSIKNGHYFEIDRLGMSGMKLVNDYPKFALIILTTLEQSLEIVMKIEDEEVKKRQTENVITHVKWIGEDNKRQHKNIQEKINEILKKCEVVNID